MLKILTHVHLYYTDMWPEIKKALEHITMEYNLFVTMVEENETLRTDILKFKPDANISIVPNKGFDIAPFIDVLNKVDLNNYDYIIKLHSKRDRPEGVLIGKYNVSGTRWRRYSLSFLKGTGAFKSCIRSFDKNPKIGMIGDFRLICKKDEADEKAVNYAMKLLENLGFEPKEYAYVMGTMFIARAALFEQIKKMNLTINDFAPSKQEASVLPYALERLFGYIVGAQGYNIKDKANSVFYRILTNIYASIRLFVWRKKVCANGKVIIKVCKIPFTKSV